MTNWTRLALLTCFAMAIGTAPVTADTINVAEFRWGSELIPGSECPADDDGCVPTDPVEQYFFSLTGIWDRASIAAPAIGGDVTLDGSIAFPWFEISSAGGFDQYAPPGLVPLSAATTIFFDFLGETRFLTSALLTAPGFTVLSFDYTPPVTPPNPVPEPGTLGLLGIGLAALARSVARRNRHTSVHNR